MTYSEQIVKDFTCKVSQKKPKCTYASQSCIASGLKDQNYQEPAAERVFYVSNIKILRLASAGLFRIWPQAISNKIPFNRVPVGHAPTHSLLNDGGKRHV